MSGKSWLEASLPSAKKGPDNQRQSSTNSGIIRI
jgi:hypothetical protein